MTPIPIPERSLERLRQSYAAFEQLAAVVLEAMDIDQTKVQQFDLKTGTIILFEESPNGVAQEVHAHD